MNDKTITRDQLAVFALALLCGFAVQVPHLIFGRAHINLDWTVHYNYARELVAAVEAGDFWPRWAFMAQEGLGEPGLLYYAPLYYLACAAAHPFTGNVWSAMQIVEIVAAGLLGYFVYLLTAAYVSHRWALLSVPIAVFSPMLCLLHLGFNGYPWATATAPIAMLQWALLRPDADERAFNLPAIIALALTILTHTVSGLMVVIMVAALPLVAVVRHRSAAWRQPAFWSPVIVVVAGLMLSAVYLYPAFTLQALIDAKVWRQNYTPFNAFSLPTVTAWTFGMRWPAFQWPISLVMMAMGVMGLIATRAQRFALPGAVVGLTVIVLSTELSYPLWQIDTPLRNIQFPHRFLTLLIPLAAFLSVVALARDRDRLLRGALALAMLGSMAMGGFTIAKAAFVDGDRPDTSERVFVPYPGLDEYRTAFVGTQERAETPFDWASECRTHTATCSTGQRHARGMRWSIRVEQPTTLRLPVHFFPSWAAAINGQPAPTDSDPQFGLATITVPKGNSIIDLQWQPLPEEKTGLLITVLGAIGIAIGAIWQRRRRASL